MQTSDETTCVVHSMLGSISSPGSALVALFAWRSPGLVYPEQRPVFGI